ncbi:MAG: hypothetical protein CMJ05_10960 [Pelagibacterales bacterium]|nr:hypothetical protein [Pelagibacterales bacterium]|tara:strand:- start:99 stop:932 length:834 start_codon:yes stop_codon:yes gene_type:complete
MKKLLLILLPISLFLVSCEGGEDEVVISFVGKKWIGYVPNYGNVIFELNNNRNLNLYSCDCDGYTLTDYLGDWSIKGDSINYTYINNNFESTELFGIIEDYNSTELKFFVNNSTNSICNIHTAPDPIDCTYIPDDGFEQELIDSGYDDVLDNFVKTSNIISVSYLGFSPNTVSDLTGIEDFTSLTHLSCSDNQITYLDISKNTNLDYVDLLHNPLYTLDLRNGKSNYIGDMFVTVGWGHNLSCVSVDDVNWANNKLLANGSNVYYFYPEPIFSNSCN